MIFLFFIFSMCGCIFDLSDAQWIITGSSGQAVEFHPHTTTTLPTPETAIGARGVEQLVHAATVLTEEETPSSLISINKVCDIDWHLSLEEWSPK